MYLFSPDLNNKREDLSSLAYVPPDLMYDRLTDAMNALVFADNTDMADTTAAPNAQVRASVYVRLSTYAGTNRT